MLEKDKTHYCTKTMCGAKIVYLCFFVARINCAHQTFV